MPGSTSSKPMKNSANSEAERARIFVPHGSQIRLIASQSLPKPSVWACEITT
jgi:hypothetical protein